MLISIIIPTRNRADTLQITLNSILRQVDLKSFEVIIIDNGSTDNTGNICEKFTQTLTPEISYYYDPEPGLLTGRHKGTELAKGEILCFLDDDVELDLHWILGVKEAFNNPEVQLATGPCLPKYDAEPPFWLKYFWRNVKGQGMACTWLSLIDLGNKESLVDPNCVWGLNFCIRKSTLIELGGFHPDNIPANLQMFQGDGETGLTIKARLRGLNAYYHPAIKLHHLIPAERLTVAYFKNRAFYQGVCNSFTLLRSKNLKDDEQSNLKTFTLKGKIFQSLKRLALNLYSCFLPKDVQIIMNLLEQKEKEGFAFHQAAFKNNPKVRAWVLKQNFWDYKLPL